LSEKLKLPNDYTENLPKMSRRLYKCPKQSKICFKSVRTLNATEKLPEASTSVLNFPRTVLDCHRPLGPF